jgi:two-component sensor histidine kinase
LFPPDRQDEELEILERIGRGERVDHFETMRQRKDESLINVSVSVSPISDESGNVVGASKIVRDITDQKRAEEWQKVLVAELNHRVKNVLARVSAVVMFTREGSCSIDEFVETLDGRIESMAHTHALLTQGEWNGVGLADLIRHELSPYTKNAVISGPDVVLTAAATEAIAMVLHELVTNAEKYGALSVRGGRVSISWNREHSGSSSASLRIDWREMEGPTVVAQPRLGYGASLIRNLVPHELGGTAELLFASDGLRCVIEIPSEHVAIRNQRSEPA